MIDGTIAGEICLGKWNKDCDIKMRETELSAWLGHMGF
jgi:hypothetical protein